MKRPTVVLGMGNPLMADEGVGVVLVKRLSDLGGSCPGVEFIDVGTGGVALLHHIEGRQKVVFVDCALMGDHPGTIRRFTPDQVLTCKDLPGRSLHEADCLAILRMARQLGQCPPDVVFFGIEPQVVAPGMQLSRCILDRLDDYTRMIWQELELQQGEIMELPRILIVDDDPDIVEAMKVVLENRGYGVDSAPDSKQGMVKIKASKPDLLILDVMMTSSQEGFVLARDLRQDPETADIPILMITATKAKTGIDFKSEAGDETWLPVDGFLDKPVKPSILIEKVEKLLKGR